MLTSLQFVIIAYTLLAGFFICTALALSIGISDMIRQNKAAAAKQAKEICEKEMEAAEELKGPVKPRKGKKKDVDSDEPPVFQPKPFKWSKKLATLTALSLILLNGFGFFAHYVSYT